MNAQTLKEAADWITPAVLENRPPLHGYCRDLALEALLRLDLVAGETDNIQKVTKVAAQEGLTPDGPGAMERGPFNCLIFWLHRATGDAAWVPGFVEQTLEYRQEVSRSPEGAIRHPRGEIRGGGQAVLIDALQDYASRMAMLGEVTGDESAFAEAVAQYRIYRDICRNPRTGLWCQGRGWRENRDELSPGAWSRGHGWLIRGMVDTLLLLPPSGALAGEMRAILAEFSETLLKHQQPSGMWHCLLHLPPESSAPEVSGTALIAGNFGMALALGFLDGSRFADAALRSFAALPSYVHPDGTVDSVSPGPGPLSETAPWETSSFPPADGHGPFALLFARLGEKLLTGD